MDINNEITSALCDMEDIKNALSDDIKNQPKDNEGTEITIGDCIYDVIYLLKTLKEQD
jgi:hypothetical protein